MSRAVRKPGQASRQWGKGFLLDEEPLKCNKKRVVVLTRTIVVSVLRCNHEKKEKLLCLQDLKNTLVSRKTNLIT